MTLAVRFHTTARAAIDNLDTWWREHRSAAASQVTDEVERITAMIAESPNIGTPYPHPVVSNVRVVRLQRTPYRLYYVHDAERDVIVVLTVWSAMRGHGPELPNP